MAQLKTDQLSEIDEGFRFEKLLAKISTFFINLPTERIDDEIETAQRQVCEFLEIDRSTLWQNSEQDPEKFYLTHIYNVQKSLEPPELMEVKEFFPWATRKVTGGEILAISKIADLPSEAARDIETWRRFGTKSTVVIPLSIGRGSVFGMVSFAVVREEIRWQENVVDGFRVLAQMFANALSRKNSELALRDRQARMNLATEAAGAGLWVMEAGSCKVLTSPKTREIFHLGPEKEITCESFYKTIHPDDVETVRRAVSKTFQNGDDLFIDYRILFSDGNMRWVRSRGQRRLGPPQEPESIMGVTIDISDLKHMEESLCDRLKEIENLKQQLEKENIYLRDVVEIGDLHEEIVGSSRAMKTVLEQVEQVARTESTVLIGGETGSGKELLAHAVHRLSVRKDRPLVVVNCASLPQTLVESELFGREKGAYTGAMTRMMGRFELADRGTLFLDEVGELPMEVQVKLLRFLEEGTFERLGSTKTLSVNVRIIAATNRDLTGMVADGEFRKDLFYRMNVFPIFIPPLRERPEDIPPLVWHFVRQFEVKMGKSFGHISRKSMEDLQRYPWPGNARELRNVIERAMIVSRGKKLELSSPLRVSSPETSQNLTLKDVERRHMLDVLGKTRWRVAGKGGAAEILGLKRTTLQAKMKRLGIKRPSP